MAASRRCPPGGGTDMGTPAAWRMPAGPAAAPRVALVSRAMPAPPVFRAKSLRARRPERARGARARGCMSVNDSGSGAPAAQVERRVCREVCRATSRRTVRLDSAQAGTIRHSSCAGPSASTPPREAHQPTARSASTPLREAHQPHCEGRRNSSSRSSISIRYVASGCRSEGPRESSTRSPPSPCSRSHCRAKARQSPGESLSSAWTP